MQVSNLEMIIKTDNMGIQFPSKIKYRVTYRKSRLIPEKKKKTEKYYKRKKIIYSKIKGLKNEIDIEVKYYEERVEPRARSKEEKQKQLSKIIRAGRQLYIKKGWEGFGMRALARHLKMSEGNLYNYVKSKRELWIAIRAQYFQEFNSRLLELIDTYRGKISYLELFERIGEFYLDFAAEDYPRYLMISVISAPKSNITGPIEKSYKPVNVMKTIQNLVDEAIKVGEIKATDSDKLAYFLYGLVYGAVKVERELEIIDPVLEPIISGSKVITIEEYRNFFFEELRRLLKA
jgi:AcrR family transcriptional regulator